MKSLTAIVIALALAGCGKKKDEPAATPPPPPAGSATGSAAAGSAAAGSAAAGSAAAGSAAAPAAKADVPTEEDFEAKAKTDIDDKNVDSKVKAIEQDLGQ